MGKIKDSRKACGLQQLSEGGCKVTGPGLHSLIPGTWAGEMVRWGLCFSVLGDGAIPSFPWEGICWWLAMLWVLTTQLGRTQSLSRDAANTLQHTGQRPQGSPDAGSAEGRTPRLLGPHIPHSAPQGCRAGLATHSFILVSTDHSLSCTHQSSHPFVHHPSTHLSIRSSTHPY